jgi:hypothetical protein
MANEYYLGESGSEEMLSSISLVVETGHEVLKSETRLASGALVRDVIARKRRWEFTWEFLPGDDTDVEDSGLGRDSLKDLFDTGGELVLKVPLETGGTDDVDVLFEGEFSERRIRVSPYFAWEVGFSLVEI